MKDKGQLALKEALQNCYLFENLLPQEIHLLLKIVHTRNFRPGEYIFKQGEIGVGMYILLSGSVDIIVTTAKESLDNANNKVVSILKPQSFFGEHSLVEENGRRSASAMAREEVQVLGFFKPDLQEIIERSPTTGVKILYRLGEILGKRLKETSVKVSELKRQIELITPPTSSHEQ